MLTLEECQNLAKWGLPQELERGDKWYWLAGVNCDVPSVEMYDGTDATGPRSPFLEHYKIPDLEELMEFAEVVFCDYCDSSYTNRNLRLEKYIGADIAPQPFVAIFLGMKGEDMDSRKLAVYKLIKRTKDERSGS